MHPFLKNIIAICLAIAAAAGITTLTIIIGHAIIPVPAGMNTNDFDSIRSNFHLYQAKHFLFPLLAHAVGTLLAAYIVSRFTASHQFWFALGIGVLFMVASIALTLKLGQWHWMGLIDIIQYIPLSLLGYYIWKKNGVSKS